MKLHRPRFGDRTLAELRGVMDEAGEAPFWDALAGKFFGMNFPEADDFNAVHGTQFIADLMPKTPIYVALLPDSAQGRHGPAPPDRARRAADARARRLRASTATSTFSTAGRRSPRRPTRSAPSANCARETVAEIGDGGTARDDFRNRAADRVPRRLRVDQAHREKRHLRRSKRPPSCSTSRSATRCCGRALSEPGRDQFRRHRRPEPQLCRAKPRQPRLDAQRRAGIAAARRCAPGHRKDARQPRARPRPGDLRSPTPAQTGRGSPSSATTIEAAEPALAANAMSASAMWAANAATVSPAPDTADGRCHLTVANLRTMAHRSHEWPATLAQLQVAFADPALRRPRAGAAGVRRRGRGQSHAAGAGTRRAGARDLRLRRVGRRFPGAPAYPGVEGDRAAARARP